MSAPGVPVSRDEEKARSLGRSLYLWEDPVRYGSDIDRRERIVAAIAAALLTARQEAAAEERAKVVAWLRHRRKWLHTEVMRGGTCDVERDQAGWLADAVARGAHLDTPTEDT